MKRKHQDPLKRTPPGDHPSGSPEELQSSHLENSDSNSASDDKRRQAPAGPAGRRGGGGALLSKSANLQDI